MQRDYGGCVRHKRREDAILITRWMCFAGFVLLCGPSFFIYPFIVYSARAGQVAIVGALGCAAFVYLTLQFFLLYHVCTGKNILDLDE